MVNITSQLTRTCSACGIEKPLSAFLQLSGAHGTSYGKICAKCRSCNAAAKPVSAITDDERSTEPSGAGIRGKEKIYIDVKREQKIHTLKELYRKQDIKKQDLADKKIDRINAKEAAEKKHRAFYIDPKKQDSLPSKKTTNQHIIARKQNQTLINARTATQRQHVTLETKKQQHIETIKTIAKNEARKTSTDFNNLFHAIEPGKIEMQGELKRFFTWLGTSAPIVNLLTKGRGFAATHTRSRREIATTNKNSQPSATRRGRP